VYWEIAEQYILNLPERGGNLNSAGLNRMTVHLGMTGENGLFCDLAVRLLEYSQEAGSLSTAKEVLDRLHAITSASLELNVLGAIRFPQRVTDWDALRLGETVFLHDTVAKGWWEEWIGQVPHKLPVGFALTWSSMVPQTWTEELQILQPIGIDRWGFELAAKYGARDGYNCPIGGRWLLSFWSAKPISKILTQPIRIVLFTAASFAAMRLDQLNGLVVRPGRASPVITPRELSVLRLLSIGMPYREVAEALTLSQETIRTHVKKAQSKLGVKSRTQAVAEALRQHLIV
jgi:DNA-binding CsgD family transcriptional regulator